MDPLDVNYLINRYSRSTASQQSDKFCDSTSSRSSFSPFRDPNSKAYASAMRALQERIRFLESENSELYESYRNSEEKFQEQRRISEKLTDDIESFKASQSANYRELADLKNNNYNLKVENSKLQKLIKDLQNHEIDDFYGENYNLKSELDVTMRDLSQRKSQEIEYLENIIKKLEDERNILQDELSDTKFRADNQIESLRKEFAKEKQRFEEEKKILQDELSNEKWRARDIINENQDIKNTLSRAQQKAHTQKVLKKQQEIQNFELQKQNEGYLNTIRDLEKKYDVLNENMKARSPTPRKPNGKNKVSCKTVSFDNNRSKSKHSKSTSPSSPRLSRPHNRHIGAHTLDYPSISERIIRMENEIEILTKKYNKLILSSKNENNGLGKLKQEIGKLAEELEAKNSELQKFKQRSQYLKD